MLLLSLIVLSSAGEPESAPALEINPNEPSIQRIEASFVHHAQVCDQSGNRFRAKVRMLKVSNLDLQLYMERQAQGSYVIEGVERTDLNAALITMSSAVFQQYQSIETVSKFRNDLWRKDCYVWASDVASFENGMTMFERAYQVYITATPPDTEKE